MTTAKPSKGRKSPSCRDQGGFIHIGTFTSQVPALPLTGSQEENWKSLLCIFLMSKEDAGASAATAQWCQVTPATSAATKAEQTQPLSEGRTV